MVEPEQPNSIISSKRSLDSICDEFETAWKSGKPLRIEIFADRARSATNRTRLIEALLETELEYVLKDRVPQEDEYLKRFPQNTDCVQNAFRKFRDRYPQRFAMTLSQGESKTIIGQPLTNQSSSDSSSPSSSDSAAIDSRYSTRTSRNERLGFSATRKNHQPFMAPPTTDFAASDGLE